MPNKQLNHNARNSISHEEIRGLPLKTFPGKIILLNEKSELPSAFREISKFDAVGFDTETRPSFVKGQIYKVSLLQLATPEKVFLVRLNYTGITQPIIDFFENEKIRKAGVGIRDDVKALNILKKFKPSGFVDLSVMAKEAGLQAESVKKLTALLLGYRISKSAQTSNWEAKTYSPKQLEYAATDAWVCLEIYGKLSSIYL